MHLLLWIILPPVAGFLLDLLVGDPRWLYHPVRLIGHLITVTERIIRNCFPKSKKGERAGGAVLVLIVLSVSMAVPALLLYGACLLDERLGILLASVMCYQILATRSLRDESEKVYQALEKEGVEAGRKAVSMIVGRDTQSLDEEGIVKAAVETVAENTSDGVIAPLFYLMLAGPVAGFGYKAVNTMDSMIGYKNEKYQFFGTAAARLDDVANYIPARLSAFLMILASACVGMDASKAARVYRRDRKNHKSPNAAQTESVMAGALGVRLAGDAWYFGVLHKKPYIGDADRPVEREDIHRAHRLLYGTALLALLVFAGARALFICFQ